MNNKNIIYTVVVFIFILSISAIVDGIRSIMFIKTFVYCGVSLTLLFLIFNYITKIVGDGNISTMIEKERDIIAKKGELSNDNPFKPLFQPLITALGKVRDIDKKLREHCNTLFNKVTQIDTANKDQDTVIENIAGHIETINLSLRDFTEKIELLNASIEESSSSTLELSASIEEVSGNVSNLFNYVDDTSTAIFQMTAISRQLSQNLENLKKVTEDTNAAMLQMEASVKEVEVKALESAKFTEEMEKDAQLGNDAIAATENSMVKIKESSNYTYKSLSELSLDIKSVSKILQVIEDIAEETALLALNAAIIAAQSGEQGKAFSVVAEEIKELAERTGMSTKEISSIIQNILVKSDKASTAITQSSKAIHEGVELTSQTGEIFKKILNSIEMADERVREIAKANIEQSKGISYIAKSTDHINQTVAEFTKAMQEQRRGSEQIILATEKIKDIANFSKNSTNEQTKTSKQIGEVVVEISSMSNFFKDQVFKFRNDFEEVTKMIILLSPNNRRIKEELNITASLLNNINKELDNLTAIRKADLSPGQNG